MNAPAGPLAPTLAERLLIVPDAHTRIEAVDFQLEMYELFHRTLGGRVGHVLGTQLVLLGIFTGTLAIHPTLGVAAATAIGIGNLTSTLRLDRLTAVIVAVHVGLLTLAAAAIATHVPDARWLGLGLTLGGTGVQTFSHLFEDVPPPHSARESFTAMGEWLRAQTFRSLVRSALLTLGIFYWLELWASLRILPFQVLHVAMLCGHRPELRRSLDARIAAIVSGELPRWRDANAR